MVIKSFITALFTLVTLSLSAQENMQHISSLNLGKKEKKVFSSRDSSITLHIDTLIMGDKSSIQFIGKKEVKLIIGYALISKNAAIYGTDGQHNGSNFDISINIQKLGSLYLIARGQDAFNGTKTLPNGNAGNVHIQLAKQSIQPQQTDKKAPNYIFVDLRPGGLNVNATSDLRNIYSQIKLSSGTGGLRGVPQGQIYSGSPGKEGKLTIE